MADLKKLLNRDELKSFKAELNNMANYMKMNFADKDYMKNIKLLRAKNRISRLEELQTKINFEVEKLYNDVDISLGEQLEQSFEDGYYKTIFNQQKFLGFSDSFAMLNTKAIKKAVTTPYMTENYSDVLWKQKSNLTNILNQQIPQGIILGYNPTKLAREVVSKRVDRQYYNNAVRLIRTEYNLILNDATAQGYKEAGIEKYQILATLDSRTSDICREMDGEIIPIKEKEVGVNYPPFHPNCRTTTIPYFEPDEFDTEIEQYIKDEDGIKHKITDDTQYEEWKNALKKDEATGTYIYENSIYRG
jgi:SPP1 gp7 family putative phage head morphogenesis protein